MLATLRSIIQAVTAADGLQETFDIIVTEISRAMKTDICSVYLLEKEKKHHLLVANFGLNPDKVGKAKIPIDKGIVGLISQRGEPFKLEEGHEHEAFFRIPNSGDEESHAFLGVPIIHQRETLGVLVVQHKTIRQFTDEDEAFLVTLCAQLASLIANAELRNLVESKVRRKKITQFISNSGAPGMAMGTGWVISASASLASINVRYCKDIDAEIKQLRKALSLSRKDIRVLATTLPKTLAKQELALFAAYEQMLSYNSLGKKIESLITEEKLCAASALRKVIDENVKRFMAMHDPYLKERASDILDLGRRVLNHLQQSNSGPTQFPKNTILVSEHLTSAMIAEVPQKYLMGIISLNGSSTSHAAILARSMGIPALMGLRDCPISALDGRTLIVDGYQNYLFVSPSRVLKEEYKQRQIKEQQVLDDLQDESTDQTTPLDGYSIPLMINSGLSENVDGELGIVVDGVGLFRSEYLFMKSNRFPTEEEQRKQYRGILNGYRGKPVVIRTLDIGGDKVLPYFPIKEDNPFLGWRGIRISLDHPEIFQTQLRAMMMANVGLGNLHISLPMVCTLSEIDKSLILIHQVYDQIQHQFKYSEEEFKFPKIGVVIEVPSAVYQIRSIAKRVDFLSIGSNDLTQYLFAVDRNNTRVSYLYESLHPAILLVLMEICEAGINEKIPVHICGEIAGNPLATIVLLAMGVSCLSMSIHSIPKVRKVIQNFNMSDATEILSNTLSFERTEDVREYLTTVLENRGLADMVGLGHH